MLRFIVRAVMKRIRTHMTACQIGRLMICALNPALTGMLAEQVEALSGGFGGNSDGTGGGTGKFGAGRKHIAQIIRFLLGNLLCLIGHRLVAVTISQLLGRRLPRIFRGHISCAPPVSNPSGIDSGRVRLAVLSALAGRGQKAYTGYKDESY